MDGKYGEQKNNIKKKDEDGERIRCTCNNTTEVYSKIQCLLLMDKYDFFAAGKERNHK